MNSPAEEERPLLSDATPHGWTSSTDGISYGTASPVLRNDHNDIDIYREIEQAGSVQQSIVHNDTGYVPCWKRIFPNGYWSEFKELWKLAGPIIISYTAGYTISVVASIFCGHLGQTEFAAVALANSMINVTGISIAFGLSSACDTIFSQIYGSNNKKQLGNALQKSLLIIILSILPCLAIQLNAEQLLLWAGQNPIAARMAGDYMLFFFPGLLALFIYVPLSTYLNCQDIVIPSLVIGLIGNAMNAVLHYLLLFVWTFGLRGSAISQMCSEIAMLIMLLCYILSSKVYENTWNGWSRQCLLGWGSFARLGMAGLLMDGVEWWSFELGIYLSGSLGTVDLGAQSVIYQLENLAYMIPLGMSVAASVRVGQFLGAGNKDGALTSARVAISTSYMTGTVMGFLFCSLRYYLPHIFTDVPEVVKLSAEVLPILALYSVFDITGVSAGIMRGSGRQTLGAVLVFCTYTVALSAAVPLMFKTDLSIAGFWWALACGLFVESIIFLIVLARTDWQKLVNQANERTRSDEVVQERCEPLTDEEQTDHHTECTALLSPINENEIAYVTNTVTTSIMMKRTSVVIIMLAIFVAGLLFRLLQPAHLPYTDLCFNGTLPANNSLPQCNSTKHLT